MSEPAFEQRVLVAADASRTEMVRPLVDRGYAVVQVGSGDELVACFRDAGAELVLMVLPLADAGSAQVMGRLRQIDRRVRVVIAGADDDVHSALDGLRLGALEYLAPGAAASDLLFVVSLLLGARRGDIHLAYLRAREAELAGLDALVAESPPMRRVLATIRALCARPPEAAPRAVLITGEAGTGKRLLAGALHYGGCRRARPFVDAAGTNLDGPALEAELFGRARDGGTGTHVGTPGLFEIADGGTLFLDEIGATTPGVQARILTAIEERRVLREGGRKPVSVDVQVVAASRRDLTAMVRFGEFGEPLYHRLHVDRIELPPLRERGEDRVLLARRFVAALCADHGIGPRRLSDDAVRLIETYRWPANLDELRNQLERIVLMVDDEVIRAAHFQVALRSRRPRKGTAS